MPVVTIFSGVFCRKESVVERLIAKTGYKSLSDNDVVREAAMLSKMDESKIGRAFGSKVSVFNKITHERERSIAWLRLAVAEMLAQDNWLLDGFCALLIPMDIAHVLRVCIIADMQFRVEQAETEQSLSVKSAQQLIRKEDEDRMKWADTLLKSRDPWDPSLYDITIPTDKTGIDECVELIVENLGSEVILPTRSSRLAANDFVLAAKVGVELAQEGHSVNVAARDGVATITIDKKVLMLSRLEEELKLIASRVKGVKNVEIRIGKGFHRADIYRKYDFDLPKLLLVDDEREFVQTLSERLLIRNLDSAVAYDGESALDMIHEDEPEVMILDLKMPGINGIEVLRKVKKTRPDIEVIILTGHGSEEDRKVCEELGAFAYLQKPIDIEVLTETLKKANAKVKDRKKSDGAQ